MNKTHTPELSSEVLGRLRVYAQLFRDDFRHEAQRSWSGVYLRGLLQEGQRKSIEPMVGRVPLPAELLTIHDPEQALQQFVNQSPWDEQAVLHRYRTVMAESFASPRGSSSSTIPASPSRASTPSASHTHTAANWASRPTARSLSRSTTSVPRVISPRRCGSL